MESKISSALKMEVVEFPPGENEIVTSASHLRAVVKQVNGFEVLTSNFYYDIIDNQPYLNSDEYVLRNYEERYPEQHARAMVKLVASGIVKKPSVVPILITAKGVLNICHVYGIDPATLLKGGPKIPLVQNGLFGGNAPTTVMDERVQGKVNTLFPNTGKKKRQARRGGKITRLHEPGITIGDDTTHSLLNLSKHLMPIVHEIDYVRQQLDKGCLDVYAGIAIGEVDGENILGIKFYENGEHTLRIKRNSASPVGMNNMSVDIKVSPLSYVTLIELFRKHNLLNTQHTKPEIAGDTILFTLSKGETE